MLYLEDFVESLDTLRNDTKLSLIEMRSVDLRVQNRLDQVYQFENQFLNNAHRWTETARDETVGKIREGYEEAVKNSEPKITLAVQMRDMLDLHLRRLDIEIKKYANDLEEDTPGITTTLEKRSLELDDVLDYHGHGGNGDVNDMFLSHFEASGFDSEDYLPSDGAVVHVSHKKGNSGNRKISRSSNKADGALAAGSSGFINSGGSNMIYTDQGLQQVVIEGAMEAAGDVYCYCRRATGGDMVGCDNESCPIEWFHYECVGLMEAPTGKWFCRECTTAGYS